MSRIIVKNLPKIITEEKLKSTFSTIGQITDVQLKYTKDGVFRQFAFIGYQNESDATEAIKQFHDTRLNTAKISVQECATLGDEKKPKSWSRYAADSSAYKKIHKKEHASDSKEEYKEKKQKKSSEDATKQLLQKYKNDPLFDEFLNVHAATKAKELLKSAVAEEEEEEGNDDSENDSEGEPGDADDALQQLANKNISDEDYLNLLKAKTPRKKMEKKPKVKVDLFTLKLMNLPYTCRKPDIRAFMRPVIPFSIRIPRNIKGIAFIGYKDESKYQQALQKHRSFIKGKQISVVKYEKKGDAPSNTTDQANPKWKTQEETLKNEEGIAESGRIFLRNLAYTITEEDVHNMFEKYGPIAEVNLPIDTTTRKMKGFGIITFVMPEHAVRAYSELDGKILHGRMLHLLPGKSKDGDKDDVEDDGATNYKKKKTKELKAQASSAHNWNALFLGHDAVADVIANNYGMSKENVLAPHGSGSAAVRLALGETQIVAATRKYLEEHGVCLDAFSIADATRSKTAILVKNLPANTQERELREKFAAHGALVRIVFPPSGITAIVEFAEPSEARKAFLKLAYSKFKSLPLYLEWAPENVLTKSDKDKKSTKEVTVKKSENNNNAVEEDTAEPETEKKFEEEIEPEPDTTLFVKNVDFRTTDEELRKHFAECGLLSYARIATKKDPNDPKTLLSMGYGFVRYVYKSSADKALKTLQFSNLAGKSLELKRSERALRDEVKKSKKSSKISKQNGTKILIRNVPFQANRNEIFELFKTFGEIKALRLPKKMTPGSDSHRGFAFIDFASNSDAKKAFEALSQSTHLYGRRLVLEWAQTEEGVDEIRKRTADHFHEQEVVRSKKSTFDLESK